MKKIIAFSIIICCFISLHAQKIKLKHTINYNAFGMGVLPHEQLMGGGNHVFYKSLGMAISYRFGMKDFLQKAESQQDFKAIKENNLFTGNTSTTYSFAFVPSIAVAITHKMPIYLGAGITRRRIYREFSEKLSGNISWIEDKSDDKILPTFTVGTFIPIYRRMLLNVAYDYLPETLFIGISIRSWESWDEFN